ncbi:MAG: penicillin-binding protein activator [Nanoarchaeota archaeon]
MNRTNITSTCTLLLIILLASCAQTQNAEPLTSQNQSIVIGAMFPLSGDAASYGEPLSRQLLLTINEINAAGGVNGRPLELKLEDSKCNAKDAATAASKLINVDGVKVIFGGACSSETLGAAPIAEKSKVILISPSATSPDITKAGDYVFRTAPSDAYAGKVAADKAIALGYRKAAIIHENTDYAQGLRKVFDKSFTTSGGSVIAVESYNPDDTDFKTQILKVKDANPDVVYIVPQAPPKGVLLIKQLKEQGVDKQLMTAEVLIGRSVVKEHGVEMEGLIGVEAAFDEQGSIASTIIGAYRSVYGEPPYPFYQAAMRDALYLVIESVKKSGYDADAIKTNLYATKDWQGAIGKLTIDENGDPILGYLVKQVKDGKLVDNK